jgi:hypothetical protein
MRRIAKGEAGVQTRPSEAAVIDSQSPSREKSRFIVAPYPNEEDQSRAGQGKGKGSGRSRAMRDTESGRTGLGEGVST